MCVLPFQKVLSETGEGVGVRGALETKLKSLTLSSASKGTILGAHKRAVSKERGFLKHAEEISAIRRIIESSDTLEVLIDRLGEMEYSPAFNAPDILALLLSYSK